MKTIAIGSIFVLIAIAAGLVVPSAYADHTTASVSLPAGSSVPGCEETNECYIPYEVTIDVGGEVTWSNDDTAAHTVTSGSAAEGPDGLFDSSLFMAGATFSEKFDDYEPGEYHYFCMVHPWMAGIVAVQAAGEEPDDHENGDQMEEKTATGMLSDETMVNLWASAPATNEIMTIETEFEDSEHVNLDIMVTQNGNVVLDTTDHHHEGKGSFTTAPLGSADPVDVKITFQGYGLPGEEDSWTGPIGQEVMFSNVVPEFGTIAALILAAAIVSIIAVSAKSRLSIIPRY